MNCKNCGELNLKDAKVCSKCGSSLEEKNNLEESSKKSPVNEVQNKVEGGKRNSNFDFVKCVIGGLLKPFKTFKENEEDLSDTKNTFIFFGIVAALMMLVNVIALIIDAVRVTSWLGEKKWVWENLKNAPWGDWIFKNLFMFAALIICLAGIFYIASLIIKKPINFNKTLSITSIAFLPMAAGILSSVILGIIWSDLTLILFALGFVYSITSFATLLNEHFKLIGDTKIYVYAVCFSVYFIALYYISINILKTTIINSMF